FASGSVLGGIVTSRRPRAAARHLLIAMYADSLVERGGHRGALDRHGPCGRLKTRRRRGFAQRAANTVDSRHVRWGVGRRDTVAKIRNLDHAHRHDTRGCRTCVISVSSERSKSQMKIGVIGAGAVGSACLLSSIL